MEEPKHESVAVMNATQLVQYDDDDENDDKFDSSHSERLVPGREMSGASAGENDTARASELQAELSAELDRMAERDRGEVDAGVHRVAEDGRDYADEVDGGVADAAYLESGLREEMVIEQTQVVAEGADMAGDALRVFTSYEIATEVGPAEDMNTSSPQGPMGSGNDYSQEDVQERGLEEAALEESVRGEHTAMYLPEESERGEENSSFSSMQQLQLRAQILVYGDLIKGILPEESLMSSAFDDAQEAVGQEAERGIGGWNWERTWQVAAEKDAEKKEAERLLDAERVDVKGEVMAEGDVINAGVDNLEPGTPSASPGRVGEDSLRGAALPVAMPQVVDLGDRSVANLDVQPVDVNGVSGSLTENLDAVVDNVGASSVANVFDDSTPKEARVELEATRSPSLDPWLKPHVSQLTPAPEPVPINESSLPKVAWVSPQAPNPVLVNPIATLITGSASLQHAFDGGIAAGSPSLVAVGHGADGIEDGSRKRNGRGREKKTPPAAKTPAAKTPAAKASAAKTPAAKTPAARGTTPRKSRAKKPPAAQVASPAGALDPNLRSAGVPSRLIYESSAAAVIVRGGSPASPNAGKKREPQVRPDLHAETQSWLEQAKVSFEEAVTAANSAAEHVQFVKSQSTPLNQGSGKEAQFSSAAAAVSAAASVAKAAAEAAKVAYEAALQATLMLSDGTDKSIGKTGAGNSIGDKDGGGRRSAIAAAKEEARKRATATPSSKAHPQSTDAVLKAAKLMAEAASQAGAVLAKGNSNVTGTVPQSPVSEDFSPRRAGRGRPRKEHTVKISEEIKVVEPSPKDAQDTRGSMKKGARRKGKDVLDVGTSKVPLKDDQGQTKFSPEKATRRQLDQLLASPADAADIPEVLQQGHIVEGSLVEVMNDEEGLRGGWFSARVLQLRAGEAFVQYDEILTDDGSTQLKEWFPLDGPLTGLERSPPRIRLSSPNNVSREEGRRKRRRTSFGQKIWIKGDLVDAFVQDGWWEGVVKQVDEIDENKITIFFPGEGDTSVVKAWNLRPSFAWKDGRWEQWTRDTQQYKKQDENQASKKQKSNESPKVQARKSGRKAKLPVVRVSDEATEISRASRSRKSTDIQGGSPLSPTITTRSSPRQKIPPKRKDVPSKLASPETEVSTPTQVSTPVSTRTRSIAEDADSPIKELRKRSASAAGLASHTKSPLSPVEESTENQSKEKVASPTKLNKLTKTIVTTSSSTVIRTRTTRQKAKELGVQET